VILNNEVVIAADEQCGEYRFSPPFFPGRSCEDIYNMNPESRTRPGYYWIPDGSWTHVYCGMNYTGSSCEDIFSNNPETRDKEGYYRINDNQWTLCNMTSGDIPTCAGVGGGWKRIVSINISAGDECPSGWREETNTESGIRFCRFDTDTGSTCTSALFSTNGTSYQRVCGRAKGYQKGETLAFHGDSASSQAAIDDSYVDGLSITYNSPRQHIWTYAVGSFDNRTDDDFTVYNCPCALNGGTDPPSFVGNNYYCESGVNHGYGSYEDYHFSDPLWDGSGCIISHCCDTPNQPWFYRDLNTATTSNLEARLCSVGEPFRRFVMIVELELYIQ